MNSITWRDKFSRWIHCLCLCLGWPIAIGVCVSVSIAGVLILYLIVHIRSAGKQRQSSSRPDADMHPQMEWEDDIGLNIIVNPLEETKVR